MGTMRARPALLQIRLSDEEEGMFEKAAEREHLSVSAWLRRLGVIEAKRTRETAWYQQPSRVATTRLTRPSGG